MVETLELPELEFGLVGYDEWVKIINNYSFTIHHVQDTNLYQAIFPSVLKKFDVFMANIVGIKNHQAITSQTREFKSLEDVVRFLDAHTSETFVPYQVLEYKIVEPDTHETRTKYYVRGAMLNG